MASPAITALRDEPFRLLQELERRSRSAASGRAHHAGAQEEWVGVAYRVAGKQFATVRTEIKEILTFPGVTRLPGAKPWLLGLANVRSQLLPVIDLNGFFGDEPTHVDRFSRVLVVNHDEIPAGLLVDEVRGFRRFTAQDRNDEDLSLKPAMRPFVAGAYRNAEEVWGVLDLHRLVESPVFLQAAQ